MSHRWHFLAVSKQGTPCSRPPDASPLVTFLHMTVVSLSTMLPSKARLAMRSSTTAMVATLKRASLHYVVFLGWALTFRRLTMHADIADLISFGLSAPFVSVFFNLVTVFAHALWIRSLFVLPCLSAYLPEPKPQYVPYAP